MLNDLIQNQLDFLLSLHLLSKWETPNTASQIAIASAGSGMTAHLEHACTETETKSEDIGQSTCYITLTTTPRESNTIIHTLYDETEAQRN